MENNRDEETIKTVNRGEIYIADLPETDGSEQSGIRPVLIIQNKKGNMYSPTTIVATITSKNKNYLPTHVYVHRNRMNGLRKNSVISTEQINTIDKKRLKSKLGTVDEVTLERVMDAVKVSLEML